MFIKILSLKKRKLAPNYTIYISERGKIFPKERKVFMQPERHNIITNLFEGKEVRCVWNSEIEDYYFSVIDVVQVLTDSNIPKRYWTDLKKKLTNEGSELYDNIVQLKIQSKKDGKYYSTDVLDTKGILRLIESIPSPKAEPFKLWLARVGSERIDEVFDPAKGIDKMLDYYLMRGYSLEWIEARIKALINRKKLVNVWKEGNIKENYEYGILTNEIYKEWSGMTSKEYKEYKGLRKERLRDNMSDIEVALTDLGEIATREIAKKKLPKGLKENIEVAKEGGKIAKITRDNLEEKLGETIISNKKNKYLS